MPAVTPRLPGPKGVNFQQFCDQLWTDLPGDHHGRESFDTSARFVVGDPGARFGSAAPLEYEVTEDHGGQPRFSQSQATGFLPTSLAGCSKVVA